LLSGDLVARAPLSATLTAAYAHETETIAIPQTAQINDINFAHMMLTLGAVRTITSGFLADALCELSVT
jgi:hypothetical protein